MLNKNNERELCYLMTIDNITPIQGADNVECAHVMGWTVMVRKGTFNPGDVAIYFEIDSKVDETKPEFAFMERYHGKIKTQRYTFGGKGLIFSQGLLMHPSDFGWTAGEVYDADGVEHKCVVSIQGEMIGRLDDDTRFLTKRLGVVYAVAEDNSRKAASVDKYKKMTQRHNKLFAKQPFRWLMRYDWGKKMLFAFFGKPKDKKSSWPAWVVKTDEERVQNMPWILQDKGEWIATEKIDGTSTTFTMKRGKKHFWGQEKNEFYVCSRNVVFDKPDKNCFYDTNVYLEMAEKYRIESVLRMILDWNPQLEWVTLQGETYGAGIQRREYGLPELHKKNPAISEHDFMGFNLIFSNEGRLNSARAAKIMSSFGVPWVPIIDEHFVLPDTVDELLAFATGASVLDGGMREGLVFRSQDGTRSFKAVSNEFLIKYHG